METNVTADLAGAFDGFSFTLSEYAEDGGRAVRRKAGDYLEDRFAGLPTSVLNEFLSVALRGRCLSMLSERVEWKKEPLGHHSEVELIVDGDSIKGETTIEPKRILARLSCHGHTASKECILLDWAPRLFTEDPFVGSEAGDDGRALAKEMLLLLCLECRSSARSMLE